MPAPNIRLSLTRGTADTGRPADDLRLRLCGAGTRPQICGSAPVGPRILLGSRMSSVADPISRVSKAAADAAVVADQLNHCFCVGHSRGWACENHTGCAVLGSEEGYRRVRRVAGVGMFVGRWGVSAESGAFDGLVGAEESVQGGVVADDSGW